MVVYRVTGGAVESGVVVGSSFFRGFPLPGAAEPDVHFAIFAFPYDAPAFDAAPPARPGRGRQRGGGQLPREGVSQVVPRAHAARGRRLPGQGGAGDRGPDPGPGRTGRPGEELPRHQPRPAQGQQRGAGRAVREVTAPLPLVEAFQQLGNSQVEASFADRRTYTYKGREIDRQDHLGYDLATTAAPRCPPPTTAWW